MGRFWLTMAVLCLLNLLLAGCGGQSVGATTSSPAPTPTPAVTSTAKFLYAANEVSGSISGYSVDASTGDLTPLAGFPVPSGINPVSLIHDPLNKFLIVVDIATNLIRVYAIDASTGALTEIPPSPYALGMEPRTAAIDPAGKFVYVASQSLNSVAAFSMDATGVLTAVPGSPFPTGGTSTTGSFGSSVVVDPTGRFVYVADLTSVYAFNINLSTGSLNLVDTVPTFSGNSLAVDPAGTFLYFVGSLSLIQTYAINPTTGALTLAASSTTATHSSSFAITLDHTGHFAFTAEADEVLVAYSLQNGIFTSLGNIFPGGLGTEQIAIDPSGLFLYAPQTGTENNISGFRINQSGSLSPIAGSPTPSGKQPFSVTIIGR